MAVAAAGHVAGDIQWPTPRKLPIGPLMNFGYEGTAAAAGAGATPGRLLRQTLEVKLNAQWLVCKDVCIPESGQFAIDMPASGATAAHGALFAQARDAVPQELPAAQAALTVDGQSLTVAVSGLPDAWHSRRLDFLPETTGVIQNAAAVQARWQGGQWLASVPLDPQRSDSPKAMPFVLVADGQARGLRLQATVGGAWPAVGATNPPPPGAAGDRRPRRRLRPAVPSAWAGRPCWRCWAACCST
jgi:DsbC/DsbD-like thiol-disulfide interchange protein